MRRYASFSQAGIDRSMFREANVQSLLVLRGNPQSVHFTSRDASDLPAVLYGSYGVLMGIVRGVPPVSNLA